MVIIPVKIDKYDTEFQVKKNLFFTNLFRNLTIFTTSLAVKDKYIYTKCIANA